MIAIYLFWAGILVLSTLPILIISVSLHRYRIRQCVINLHQLGTFIKIELENWTLSTTGKNQLTVLHGNKQEPIPEEREPLQMALEKKVKFKISKPKRYHGIRTNRKKNVEPNSGTNDRLGENEDNRPTRKTSTSLVLKATHCDSCGFIGTISITENAEGSRTHFTHFHPKPSEELVKLIR